jgi:hypothetical protein
LHYEKFPFNLAFRDFQGDSDHQSEVGNHTDPNAQTLPNNLDSQFFLNTEEEKGIEDALMMEEAKSNEEMSISDE